MLSQEEPSFEFGIENCTDLLIGELEFDITKYSTLSIADAPDPESGAQGWSLALGIDGDDDRLGRRLPVRLRIW